MMRVVCIAFAVAALTTATVGQEGGSTQASGSTQARVMLEGIRLDLLRLQMGSAPIESVTATLDAARQIGERIGESIAAQREVDRLLDNSRVRTGALPSLAALPLDDDADTPVHGVSATRG